MEDGSHSLMSPFPGEGVGVVGSPVHVLVAKDPPSTPSAPLRRVDGAGCQFSGL